MLHQNSHITTCIENSLQQYFTDLDGQPAHDVYQMVLQQVELPLLPNPHIFQVASELQTTRNTN